MKIQNSKAFLGLMIIGCFAFVLSSQVAFSAQKNTNLKGQDFAENKKEVNSEKALDKVCEKIEDTYSKILERGSALEAKIETKREQRRNTYEKRIAEIKQETSEDRGRVDDNFEANISRMMSQVETQEEKEAIEAFREAVESAREKRRLAVDDAKETFRETVRNQIQIREQALVGLISDFKSDVEKAFGVAETTCESGTDIKNIRATFKKSLKSAQSSFQNQKRNREKVGSVVSQATKTKNTAIEKANQEFKSALKTAMASLKKVLPEESGETEETD